LTQPSPSSGLYPFQAAELRVPNCSMPLAPTDPLGFVFYVMYNAYIVMRRTQIYLDDRQRRKLDRVAKRTRRTVSDLIREAIDARYAATPREDFLEALRAGAFGVWKERTDLGQTDAYLRRQRRGSRLNRLAG
jgi:predicted DNA-binding protein